MVPLKMPENIAANVLSVMRARPLLASPTTITESPGLMPKVSRASLGMTICPFSPTFAEPNIYFPSSSSIHIFLLHPAVGMTIHTFHTHYTQRRRVCQVSVVKMPCKKDQNTATAFSVPHNRWQSRKMKRVQRLTGGRFGTGRRGRRPLPRASIQITGGVKPVVQKGSHLDLHASRRPVGKLEKTTT